MVDKSRLKSSKRYRKIMNMVMRFGVQLWWLNLTNRFRNANKRAEKKSKLFAKQAKVFTDTATEMGGLIIKLGQYISAQIGIIPPEYLSELSKLQDSVKPAPTELIIKQIEQELGAAPHLMFKNFDHTPVAAASLGQVYKAQLKTGEEVAVKVLRPGIEDIIEIDLQALKDALRLINRRSKISNYMDVDSFYLEFKDTLLDELDFVKEANNAETFQINLLQNMFVDIPKIYWDYSTKKVLTMEYMHGVKINDLEQLLLRDIDMKALASHIVGIYAQMVLSDGFFHADPHPGNILVRDDGTLLLLDFGMVGRIDETMRESFIDFGLAVVSSDSDMAVKALKGLGFIRSDADTRAFAKNFMTLFNRMLGKTSRSDFSLSESALEEISEFMRSQPFKLPSNVTFLGKAIVTAIGLATSLYAKVDLVEEVRPYVEDIMGNSMNEDVVSRFFDQGQALLKTIIPTAMKAISVIDRLDSGELAVRISTTQEQRVVSQQIKQVNRLISTIIGGTLFISGVILLPDPRFMIFSYILLGFGSVLMLVQLLARRSQKKRSQRRHPGF